MKFRVGYTLNEIIAIWVKIFSIGDSSQQDIYGKQKFTKEDCKDVKVLVQRLPAPYCLGLSRE